MTVWRILESFGIENLRPIDLPEPTAGPGQAVVRVRACSLNYRDLLVAQGGYGRAVKAPLTPLSDGAGEVVAVGPGVSKWKAGDRVAGSFFKEWRSGTFKTEYQTFILIVDVKAMTSAVFC